ncbi:transposase [Streptomyces sp. GLT-R25]
MISCGSFSSRCFRRGPMKTPGPLPVPDRQCLQGILYVLHTGIGWEDLPQELGFRSGMTCWPADQAVDQRRGVRRSASDPACPAERGKRDRLVPGGDPRQPHRHEKKRVPNLEFAPVSSPT